MGQVTLPVMVIAIGAVVVCAFLLSCVIALTQANLKMYTEIMKNSAFDSRAKKHGHDGGEEI